MRKTIEQLNGKKAVDKIEADLRGTQTHVLLTDWDNHLLYLEGYKYPLKGIPDIESVQIANKIKENLKKGKIVIPPKTYLGDFAVEICILLTNIGLKKLAYPIAFVLEYDQAYRLRLQDLFSSVSQEQLENPLTILKLSTVHKKRDKGNHVHPKLRIFFWAAFLYALVHKKAWKQAIKSVDYQNLVLDESDIYWACHKTDYNYLGKTFAERQKMLKSI